VIPCFNEEDSIPQLMSKLKDLENKLVTKYDYRFVFVDDGSTDKTFEMLTNSIPSIKNGNIVRHHVNQNLGASLKTGVKNSVGTDYITFLDSDCTYEPDIILGLLEKLDQGCDLVTVSPYHPLGKVEGVPPWRLLLSKGLCVIYRMILKGNYATYTAMVRGIRTDKVQAILSQQNDFSFVAESFIMAIKLNYIVVEIPTILKYNQND
jgi:dolichol-phosphate mannosyltransferase